MVETDQPRTLAVCSVEDCTLEDWILMYRSGHSGADVAKECDVDDILEVLKALVIARREDPSLEVEHTANLLGYAREIQEATAAARVMTPSWLRRINELDTFVTENGRMPRQLGGDKTETALGRWLHAQRGKVTKGTLDPRQRRALDSVGAWDSDRRAKRDRDKFPAQLEAVAEFKAANNRWPTYMNRGDSDECVLGTWLFTARQAAAAGRLATALWRALDATLPGWDR
ncbi:MAG TPA: helicase associated domain-containing protein [Arthrobacter sp.]